MSENKQLVRKNNGGGYNNVYPYSYTETVKDKKTGKSLEEILVSTNFLYLPYRGSKAATRLQVDERYRRKGLWVQYVTDLGNVIVEYYNNNDISDTKWVDDKYWTQYNSAQFNPGTVGLDALSQEAKDYLLTNSPVNTEDITRDNQSRLQLSDRAYNPASFSGKGYKILRQNILNGTNILAQSMILSANTIYEIRYDYDLQGQEINIPEGCVLKFNGGSLSNGKLIGNYTFIKSSNTKIFDSCIVTGTYLNTESYPEWFGDCTEEDCSSYIQQALYMQLPRVVFTGNIYKVKSTLNCKFSNILLGRNTVIQANGEMDVLISIQDKDTLPEDYNKIENVSYYYNYVIEGGCIDGNNLAETVIHISNMGRSFIQNIRIQTPKSVGVHLDGDGGLQCHLNKVYIHNLVKDNSKIAVLYESPDSLITHCEFVGFIKFIKVAATLCFCDNVHCWVELPSNITPEDYRDSAMFVVTTNYAKLFLSNNVCDSIRRYIEIQDNLIVSVHSFNTTHYGYYNNSSEDIKDFVPLVIDNINSTVSGIILGYNLDAYTPSTVYSKVNSISNLDRATELIFKINGNASLYNKADKWIGGIGKNLSKESFNNDYYESNLAVKRLKNSTNVKMLIDGIPFSFNLVNTNKITIV